MKTFCFLLLFGSGVLAVGQSNCSAFNNNASPLDWNVSGVEGHNSGQHGFSVALGGSCTYSGTTPGHACASTCTSTASGWVESETGSVTPIGYQHQLGENTNTGQTQAPNGGATQCAVTAAAAVNSCLISCAVTISFSGSASGLGESVSFPPQAIFAKSTPLQIDCAAESLPKGGGGGTGGTGCCGGGEICGGREVCDPSGCGCADGSPIIVDTTGKGFHLTSAENGVKFDILGSGRPVRVAWTEADSGNAFLALDRNHNGRIDNGRELFGNRTAQPKSLEPNGYLALEEFDKPENGGNDDGIIDARDAVFAHLLLWIDANHDGISQPEELHTLPELGVFSIALHYRDLPYTDVYGNWFHYRAALNPDPHDGESHDGRWTYDVFFVTGTDAHTCPKKIGFDLSQIDRLELK